MGLSLVIFPVFFCIITAAFGFPYEQHKVRVLLNQLIEIYNHKFQYFVSQILHFFSSWESARPLENVQLVKFVALALLNCKGQDVSDHQQQTHSS